MTAPLDGGEHDVVSGYPGITDAKLSDSKNDSVSGKGIFRQAGVCHGIVILLSKAVLCREFAIRDRISHISDMTPPGTSRGSGRDVRCRSSLSRKEPIMPEEMRPDELAAIVNGYRQSRIVLTAVELGVFTELRDGARSAEQVANALNTQPRPTDRLLNALAAMGLLRKEEGRFSNTETSARHLVRGERGYMGNIEHGVHLWDYWSRLTDVVRSGIVEDRVRLAERGEEWHEAFMAAMHYRALAQAPGDVNLIDFHDAVRVLDVGGGTGVYSMAMMKVKQDLSATVFDLPGIVPITRRYVEEAGLSHRIDTVAGDYLVDVLPGGYDIVFLSAIVHSNSPEENTLLINKCAAAVNPGGRVIVQDFIMEEDRVFPPHGALFAINMLVATEAGDTYTEAEVRQWMEAAGLTDLTRHDTPSGATQVSGKRPAGRNSG
jgi:2-polyprenyl-3-methyl-5-hydroxy-6-metoxy-1,4-benzoquinol methylase